MNLLRSTTSVPAALVVIVVALSIGLQSQTPETTTPTPNPTLETVVAFGDATATPTESGTPEPSATPTETMVPTATLTPRPTTIPTPKLPVRTARVPILMYHYISVPPPDADKIRLDLSVTPGAFREQVAYLANAGYHPIRLSDVAAFLTNGTPLPDKPIVFSFDDGYADNYTNAFPVLKEHGFPGTFFIVTDWVQANRNGYLSWEQLDEMAKGGMEIGSHTLNHPELRGKTRTYQNKQLVESKQAIESRLGLTVTALSYPAGRFDANTLAALKAAGYTSAVTESAGTRQNTDIVYELKRVRVRGSYSVADLGNWIKYYSENGR